MLNRLYSYISSFGPPLDDLPLALDLCRGGRHLHGGGLAGRAAAQEHRAPGEEGADRQAGLSREVESTSRKGAT